MATTDVPVWEGEPPLITRAKVDEIHTLLAGAMGDLDKTDDAESAEYYQGLVDAYTAALDILFDVA